MKRDNTSWWYAHGDALIFGGVSFLVTSTVLAWFLMSGID